MARFSQRCDTGLDERKWRCEVRLERQAPGFDPLLDERRDPTLEARRVHHRGAIDQDVQTPNTLDDGFGNSPDARSVEQVDGQWEGFDPVVSIDSVGECAASARI